jgi:nucleotide-binding universal stress UspA family protein
MKILLAIDDSEFSKAATQAVIARIRPRGTQVRVLHVVEPPSLLVTREMHDDPAIDTAWKAELELKQAETLVANTAGTLRSKGLKVSTSVEQGDPKSKIVDAASKWHADLIVVGAHGRKGLARFLMGSVSEGVARHAPCSVEIVRIPSRR